MIDPASNPSTLTSINPATMEKVGQVAVSNAEQVHESVRLAGEAFPAWRDATAAARAGILKKAQQLLISKSEDMAACITKEMGRPFVESMVMEVESTVDLIGYCAGRTAGLMRPRKTSLHHLLFKRRKSVVIPQPLGALGVIAPWNWPLLIPMGCIVPALATGNTVVFKPSELTPLTGRKIGELLWEAGVPEGVFRVVQGKAGTGHALAASKVEKLFFTGSTEVGRRIMEQAAPSLKKVVLEMGGNDAAVVCEDADLDFTSSGILWGGMNNCGQNCNSVERVFVHRKVIGGFIGRLVEKSKRLRVGDGMNPGTDMGPLASTGQIGKMESIIRKSKDQNGRVLCGGNRPAGLPGYFFEPAILFHETMPAFLPGEELFGPVLVVIPVRDDDEAVRMANQSVFGLSASVWTGNAKRGEALAARLETGSVMVNDVVVSFGITEASWTGIKKSGVGWVHGEKGMDEMLNLKYVNRDPQDRMQKYWWFPYGNGMVKGIKAGMVFMHGSGIGRKMKAMPRTLVSFTGYLLGNRRKRGKL